MSTESQLENKVVVVTGASSGIGAALAEAAARRGAKVALVARREKELRDVADKCGTDAFVVLADVTKRVEVFAARDQVVSRFGRIDVWVNNAGRGITREVSELTDEDLDEMMLVNVKSAVYGMQAAFEHFRQRNAGHIINVSSLLGRVPLAAFRSAYSASKHALNALTASLRMELAEKYPGIHVSTVSPGIVATEFGSNALHGGVDSRTLPSAQPVAEVASVIADLIASPRADVYTRPEAQKMIVSYFSAEDMGAAELRFQPGR